MAQMQVKSLLIGELISISMVCTHKLGNVVTFDLATGKKEGQGLSSVQTLHGPTPERLLIVEIKIKKDFNFKIQLDIAPSTTHFSVLMYHIGPEQRVSVPGLKSPLKLTGPAFIFAGSDIFAYDGKSEITAHHGYIVESCPLMIFIVGRNIMLQNRYKRRSIKLPANVANKGTLLLASANLVSDVDNDEANDVMSSLNAIPIPKL